MAFGMGLSALGGYLNFTSYADPEQAFIALGPYLWLVVSGQFLFVSGALVFWLGSVRATGRGDV